MREDSAIRVGLVGFGFVSKTFHVPLLQATDGYKITAVSSSHPAEVLAVLPGVDVVADPNLLATHPDVDLVVIASPNETHVPLAELAMRAGHNVVVDKPFTITVGQARHLAAVAREKDVLLSVFQNRRWDSDFLTIRDAIRRDLTGRIVLFESRIDRYRPDVRDRWREVPGPGPGLLYDLARVYQDTGDTNLAYTTFLEVYGMNTNYRDVVERALALIDRAEYKRRQAPPGVRLTPKAFGRDRRTPITNRWRG